MAENIQKHIFLPIPSIKAQPNISDLGRKERLHIITANVEKNHKQVRANIIASAKAELEQHQASNTAENQADEDPDAMDISPASPSSSRQTHQTLPPDALDLLLSNLRAPTPPPGVDPYQSSRLKVPRPPSHIRQTTPPPNMQLAKRTLDAVERYDEHAKDLTRFYEDALQRQTGGPPAPRPAARRGEDGGMWGQTPAYPSRGVQQQMGRGAVGASPRNASPRDAVLLDPRRVGRRS